MIASHLIAGKGIDAGSTDGTHQFVELVSHRNLGVLIREGVDEMIDSLALCGVGSSTVHFV